jgi:hypothetical protein
VSVEFCSLSAALDYARGDAGAKEAGIEIWVEGFYIFAQQDDGWPSRIVAEHSAESTPIPSQASSRLF